MAGAWSGVIPAHGASSSPDRRSPSTRSGPSAPRTAARTSRAKRRRSVPHSSPRWFVRPERNCRIRLCWPALTSTPSSPAAAAEAAAVPKPVTTAAMSSGLHPLRHLAAVDLRHARRRPQRPLGVRGRPLAAGVAEGGDGQRALGPDRGRDAGPPVGAALGQRRPLVGPVALVDAGLLDHDRPAAAERPPPVVREVASREGAVVVAQVRHVGPEEHAVGRGPRAEADGREEPPGGGRLGHQR